MKNLSPKEAIALLRNLEDSLDSYCGLNEEGKTAFRMAIEALSCSEIPNNSDTIYRQAAIDTLKELTANGTNKGMVFGEDAVHRIEILPSAQPDIIRCKDCAYCDSDVVDAPYGMTRKIFWCDRLYAGANENLIVEPDNFCSWAERREK